MALGMSSALASACLTGQVATYDHVKLHKTGEPGAAGTSNPATETDRQPVAWTAPSVGSTTVTFSNVDDLVWVSVAADEDYEYFSAWDALTVGAFGFSGTVTANPVVAGDTFTIPSGDLDASFPIAT